MLKNHVSEPLTGFFAEEKKVKTSSGQEVYLATGLRVEATGRPNVWKQYKKMD